MPINAAICRLRFHTDVPWLVLVQCANRAWQETDRVSAALEFGIKNIPFEEERNRFDHSVQHAPQDIWEKWGPFTSSFAIVRDHYSKFFQALDISETYGGHPIRLKLWHVEKSTH